MTWSSPSFDLPPVADRVGPFPHRRWLQTWWESRGRGELVVADTPESLICLTLVDGVVEFAGEADLTDYHSPLGHSDTLALANLVADLEPGTQLCLDSLPGEAADAVAGALTQAGLQTSVAQHEIAAVLDLPATFDDYLASIGKKERHEMRRKRRRFDNEVGPGRVERREGPEAVSLFARLHRLSAGDKGEFMTEDLERFFLALHTDAGGIIEELVDGDGRPASAIFSFEDEHGFYLYNSAFEPGLRTLSPGNVMLSHLIERAIGRGLTVFDFLKGDETYKFRLGATERPLYLVSATVGR